MVEQCFCGEETLRIRDEAEEPGSDVQLVQWVSGEWMTVTIIAQCD
jgi:hypothetical protein